jgi:hypothetical protein
MERYAECGCCGHWHRESYRGDCRNDAERLDTSQLEDRYGESLFWDKLAIPLEDDDSCS